MKGWRGILLVGSLLFIATATLTPGSPFSAGTQAPNFFCFACGSEGGADVTLNFALFIPFGVALALLGATPLRGLFAGLLLTMAIECAQKYGIAPDRVASATDIVTNTAGAFVGALVAWYRWQWLRPTTRTARILAVGGALSVCAFLYFTAWALSPDVAPVASTNDTRFHISQFPYTPGYGWYHGRVTQTMMNEKSFAHSGDGPVILRGALPGELRGTVALSGRDERDGFLPFVYVHDIQVTQPELMLGQQGADARMHVTLRGRQLRFPGPSILLRDAFSETNDGAQTVSFSVTPKSWALSSLTARGAKSTVLPVSLSLGWTLLQTVVHVGDRGAWIFSVSWLFVMWLPIGYWCVFAGRNEPTKPVIAGAVALVLTLWLVPAVATIARCLPFEWGSAIGGMASGVFFAMRSRTKLRDAR